LIGGNSHKLGPYRGITTPSPLDDFRGLEVEQRVGLSFGSHLGLITVTAGKPMSLSRCLGLRNAQTFDPRPICAYNLVKHDVLWGRTME
jgi:hypothetical protein